MKYFSLMLSEATGNSFDEVLTEPHAQRRCARKGLRAERPKKRNFNGCGTRSRLWFLPTLSRAIKNHICLCRTMWFSIILAS